jgi:hypothetical protein
MRWRDWRGYERSAEIKLVVDARDVEGLAGYPWIIIAANPQLSNATIQRFLSECGIDSVERPLSWIQRKRFMFRQKKDNLRGPPSNLDGNYVRAIRIMRAHPSLSARQMVYKLKEHRIERSRTWILQHRGDRLPSAAEL